MLLKEILKEGTWAVPYTTEMAKKLRKLMSEPIQLKNAAKQLHPFIGNDGLFDEFLKLKERGDLDVDVRYLAQSTLKDWLTKLDEFKEKWDKEAIDIVKEIVKCHY